MRWWGLGRNHGRNRGRNRAERRNLWLRRVVDSGGGVQRELRRGQMFRRVSSAGARVQGGRTEDRIRMHALISFTIRARSNKFTRGELLLKLDAVSVALLVSLASPSVWTVVKGLWTWRAVFCARGSLSPQEEPAWATSRSICRSSGAQNPCHPTLIGPARPQGLWTNTGSNTFSVGCLKPRSSRP